MIGMMRDNFKNIGKLVDGAFSKLGHDIGHRADMEKIHKISVITNNSDDDVYNTKCSGCGINMYIIVTGGIVTSRTLGGIVTSRTLGSILTPGIGRQAICSKFNSIK